MRLSAAGLAKDKDFKAIANTLRKTFKAQLKRRKSSKSKLSRSAFRSARKSARSTERKSLKFLREVSGWSAVDSLKTVRKLIKSGKAVRDRYPSLRKLSATERKTLLNKAFASVYSERAMGNDIHAVKRISGATGNVKLCYAKCDTVYLTAFVSESVLLGVVLVAVGVTVIGGLLAVASFIWTTWLLVQAWENCAERCEEKHL